MRLNSKTKRKLTYITIALLGFLIFFVFIKYLFPLFLPFILGYAFSKLILPSVNFLNRKLNFHIITATLIMLVLLILCLSISIYFLASKLTMQITDFIRNWEYYYDSIDNLTKDCCYAISKYTGVSGNTLYVNISAQADNAFNAIKDRFTPELMNYSIATIKGLIDIMIFILITFISLFFFTKDHEKISHYMKSCILHDEIEFMQNIIHTVVSAYIKSQLIIMSLVAIICTIGFTLVKNPYSILYGIIVGILDILPLIGAGTFLLPISIFYGLKGNFLGSIILFVTFILCYLIREILEPRLMGARIGIHPLASLIAIFVGYKIFGFIGMIAGPFGLVFIRELLIIKNKEFCSY